MKYCIVFSFVIFFLSCTQTKSTQQQQYRTNFSEVETQIIVTAKGVIKNSHYTSLITIDEFNQPRARVMETFKPEEGFVIWMGTNPRSRKIQQIQKNPKATLHYFDRTNMAYVSLMGEAFIVNDTETKSQKWKEGWERFYKNRTDDYMLIKFVPETLELIGMLDGFSGDSLTWAPHKVILRK